MLLTAFVTGLVGSLHCLGMCSPIAMALPRSGNTILALLPGRLLYNTGRIITYTIMGGIIGLLGYSIQLTGMQQNLSIILGVMLLLLAIFSLNVEKRFFAVPVVERFMGKIRGRLGTYFGNPAPGSLLSIGMLNGLLPCGFVYLALSGAAVQGHVLDSMSYMVLFGLGTTPMMLFMGLAGLKLPKALKSNVRPLLSAFAIGFALLLIMRGLALDIPYISPAAPTAEVASNCG